MLEGGAADAGEAGAAGAEGAWTGAIIVGTSGAGAAIALVLTRHSTGAGADVLEAERWREDCRLDSLERERVSRLCRDSGRELTLRRRLLQRLRERERRRASWLC